MSTASFRTASPGRAFDIEPLERRLLWSSSIPLSTAAWTALGPASLTSSGVKWAGRLLDIAAHPSDASTWYVASAGGGIFKTTNAGVNWTALTDQQAINFMGSVAISPSNPNVLYAGTGEATWGQTKKNLFRENIYYGLGVLKSVDAGATWTLTGQTEFYRRAIGKVIVHPTDPNTVYAAVGQLANNGLPGNTGIWKTIDGGANWTNTTTSISTTAAFSDLVMDPSNPQVLYAGVGENTGSATNGLYKSTNGGASWSPVSTFPLQNDARLGRITLAIAPSNGSIVYASVAASGQSGTTVGAHLQFVRSPDAGATWSARTAISVGNSLDYNIALTVDPANFDTVYIAGQSGATSIRKSTNGGSTWSNIGTGGENPHPDHHALVFAADGRLLIGNDGGIWRLDNPNPGSILWSSRNGDMNSMQFVGIGLHPTNPDIVYGGAQDNGTEKFTDALQWNLIRGGDGGVIRVDQDNPDTMYHTFYYSGNTFFERTDNAGLNWAPLTSGINVATDPANFYPPYVMDPGDSTRLVLGTNRVYETTTRADFWSPRSVVNSNGWTTNARIDALGLAKTNANVIYASAGGKVFVTSNNGTTWSERNIPFAADRFDDIVVDPSDANVAYFVRDRFNSPGNTGHVFRTTNAGLSWADITGNLPDLPATAIELDVRGPGVADDVLYVGTDIGVYWSTDLGATWAVLSTGLPKVQIRELEYQKNLGILAAGTHGRGLWELLVPDVTAPVVTTSSFAFATAPQRLSFRFSESVNSSFSVADLTLQNLTTASTIPSGNIALTYDNRTDTANFTFPGYTSGALPDGRYRATLLGTGTTDGAGNPLAANYVFDFYFLRGDADHDADVDLDDFNILASNFGQSPRDFSQGDFTYNSVVDLDDFNLLASNFGTSVGPGASRDALGALVFSRGPSRILDGGRAGSILDTEADALV